MALSPTSRRNFLRIAAGGVATAGLAAAPGASCGLRAAGPGPPATAVGAGADRFLTNNAKDFPKSIIEIDITYPLDLPDPTRR